MLDTYLQQAFLMVLICSAIPLALSSLAALVVAILQAATQIQEQSIGFLVKFGCLALILSLGFKPLASQLTVFTQTLLSSLSLLGRMP